MDYQKHLVLLKNAYNILDNQIKNAYNNSIDEHDVKVLKKQQQSIAEEIDRLTDKFKNNID